MIEANPYHYNFNKYSKLYRWADYWHQINVIAELNPGTVLEIGKGEGVVGYYLKHRLGLSYAVVDRDARLRPDIVGNALDLPIPDKSFDIACAFEVLEHLPFAKFGLALSELKRAASKNIIISLPHWGPSLAIDIRLPVKVFGCKRIKWLYKFDYFPPEHKVTGHHWEMGKRGYSLKKIKDEIKKAGLTIERHFIAFESPYHHFFILKPN